MTLNFGKHNYRKQCTYIVFMNTIIIIDFQADIIRNEIIYLHKSLHLSYRLRSSIESR